MLAFLVMSDSGFAKGRSLPRKAAEASGPRGAISRAGFLRMQMIGHLRGATNPGEMGLGGDLAFGAYFAHQLALNLGLGLDFSNADDLPWDKTANAYLDAEIYPKRWEWADPYWLVGVGVLGPMTDHRGLSSGALRVGAGIHQYTGEKMSSGNFSRETTAAFGARVVGRGYRSYFGKGGLAFDVQLQVYLDFSFAFKMPKLMNI